MKHEHVQATHRVKHSTTRHRLSTLIDYIHYFYYQIDTLMRNDMCKNVYCQYVILIFVSKIETRKYSCSLFIVHTNTFKHLFVCDTNDLQHNRCKWFNHNIVFFTEWTFIDAIKNKIYVLSLAYIVVLWFLYILYIYI